MSTTSAQRRPASPNISSCASIISSGERNGIGHLTFLTTRGGKSYSTNGFSNQFRTWCDLAGLPERCVFHGLRKAAGCTAHEIAAMTGHATLGEVQRYTKAVDQARMARAAMARTAAAREQTEAESVKPKPAEVSNPLKALAEK